MKSLMKAGLLTIVLFSAMAAQAQTADEIINKYIANTGGKDKWAALKSVKMTGKAKAQGMEIPVTILRGEGGKQKVVATFQGKEITQVAFDGNTGWTTNFMTMKAEKMDAEASENMKREAGDFPDAFHDYKKKGYKIAMEGKETVEGTECFKVKLTKTPLKVDGKEEENVSYYFFDSQNYVPIVTRSTAKTGQMKGTNVESVMSDYQDVNGLMLPLSVTVKYNGQTGQTITFDKVDTNIKIDDKEFVFPETK